MTGTNTFTAADLVAVIPEKWTGVVLEAYFAKTVAANFFLDLSDMARNGGDIFHELTWLIGETIYRKFRKLRETLILGQSAAKLFTTP